MIKITTLPEKKRIIDLLSFIQNQNNNGIAPSSADIYKAVEMAKATALKHLAVLQAKGLVDYLFIGPTKLWYISKDEKGHSICPRTIFEKKI
jgi:hypothetical protein